MNAGELKFSAYFKKIHWFYIKHKGYGRCQMACVCRLARFLCFREMFSFILAAPMSPRDWNLVINLNNRPLFKGLKSIFILESFKISLFVKNNCVFSCLWSFAAAKLHFEVPLLVTGLSIYYLFSVINLLKQYLNLLNRVSNR